MKKEQSKHDKIGREKGGKKERGKRGRGQNEKGRGLWRKSIKEEEVNDTSLLQHQ